MVVLTYSPNKSYSPPEISGFHKQVLKPIGLSLNKATLFLPTFLGKNWSQERFVVSDFLCPSDMGTCLKISHPLTSTGHASFYIKKQCIFVGALFFETCTTDHKYHNRCFFKFDAKGTLLQIHHMKCFVHSVFCESLLIVGRIGTNQFGDVSSTS